MKIPSVKGTRDFYPPVMAVRNFIVDGWKAASRRSGFEEYDGPIFEHLMMYQVKSGEEIVEQLFHLTDRGGRELAIRPEITPTLARMVGQQVNSLPRPIKWFSVPRLCRAERPQKGRLREFFQWNLDVVGVADPLADAEVIFTTLDYLADVGLGPADVQARISSRRLLAAYLRALGLAQDRLDAVYPVLDKKPKVPPEAFEEMLRTCVPEEPIAAGIRRFMELTDAAELAGLSLPDGTQAEAFEAARRELADVMRWLDRMGMGAYCRFDPGIVRGLAYYTGVVFEVHEASGSLRAICGGGRYDNLLADFGGPAMPATGMGMGDCVLEILLREKGLLADDLPTRRLDWYVCCLDEALMDAAVEAVAALRRSGRAADMAYKPAGLGKQLKWAAAAHAGRVAILGREFLEDRRIIIKDMQTGEQKSVDFDRFLLGHHND